MLANLIYVGCVAFWILAAYTSFTPGGSGWRHGVTMLVLLSVIVLVVLGRPSAGQKGLQRPTFGTPSLRRALYLTILGAAIVADVDWFPSPECSRCPNSMAALVAALILLPLLSEEARAREERVGNA